MRRLVAAGLMGMLALALAGCGGGASQTATTTTTPAATEATAAVSVVSTVPVTIPDRSAPESRTFEPFPNDEIVPAEIKDRVAAKQPMLIFFYNKDQATTADQRAVIDAVLKENRGLVDLVAYELGQYSSSDDGVISTDTKITGDDAASKAVLLARQLKVGYTPFIVIVDDQGYITFRARGPIDAGLLEPEVLRAAK